MKKSKKILLTMSVITVAVIPTAILSSKCDNSTAEKKEELEKETKLREINNLANSLEINFDNSKTSIEEALKIENYKFNLSADKQFALVSLSKVNDNKIKLIFKIKDVNDSSIVSQNITREFNFDFQKDNEFNEQGSTVNGLEIDNYSSIINLFNLNKEQYIEEAKKLLVETKQNDNVEISNLSVDAYDESEGTLSVTFDYKNKNNNKETKGQTATISNFKKIEVFKENLISISANKEKLIEDKKKIETLENTDLSNYLNITVLSSNGEKNNILDLIKNKSEKYKLSREISFSNSTTKENVNFEITVNYLKKITNQEVETITKKIDVLRKTIAEKNVSNQDILNYIIDNKINKKDNNDLSKKFPSSYLYNFRNTKKIAHNFLNNSEENYFGSNNKIIQFSNETLTVDDIAGTVNISFNLEIEEGGSKTLSKSRTFTFNGFKQFDNKYGENFQILLNSTSETGKKFIQKVKEEYKKNNSNELELGLDWLKTNSIITDSNVLLRLVEDSSTKQPKLENKTNTLFTLNAGGRNIQETIVHETKIQIFDGKEEFELNNLVAKFKNLKISEINNNRVWFEVYYDLEISLNSSSNQEIIIPQKFTWFFDINENNN
ncbi:hypothetical protein [Metamycoplasma gateae]|uniref:Lipoprotein-associated type-17 domain-containing protein n=1 Tax=Metamycoplasma gateae TaxID=35769 RepID=A0ABZ2AI42_9BACT|nr:hypothetical protein V2E26_01015 [Metamycoplasma gateae]